MALLFWDGLDNYSTVTELQNARTDLLSLVPNTTLYTTSGRYGGCAINDTSTLNIGTGGTLGSAAFTASTAY